MHVLQTTAAVVGLMALAYGGAVLIARFWGWLMDLCLGPVNLEKDESP